MAPRLTFRDGPEVAIRATGSVTGTWAFDGLVAAAGSNLVVFGDEVVFEREAEGVFGGLAYDAEGALLHVADNPRAGGERASAPRLLRFAADGSLEGAIDLGALLGAADLRSVNAIEALEGELFLLSSTAERPDTVALHRVDWEAGELIDSVVVRDRSDEGLVPVSLQRSADHFCIHGRGPTRVFDRELRPIETLPLEGDRLAFDHAAGIVAMGGPGGIRVAERADGYRQQRFLRYALKGRAVPNDHSFCMGPGGSWFAVGFEDRVHVYDSKGAQLGASGVGGHVAGLLPRQAREGSTELAVLGSSPRIVVLDDLLR